MDALERESAPGADLPLNGQVTPTGDPILVSKLHIPAVTMPVVERARLHRLLTRGVAGPLTLVSAPAGSGKTVLVSTWAARGSAPGTVVWVSLDEADDAAGVFWSYVLAGLRRAGVDVGSVSPPGRAKAVEQALLVRLAAAFSERAEPVVLVLDNAEGLTRPDITDGLDFLLRRAAGGVRLVIIARVDPHWPLARYRLDGWVTEIRFPELAFTPGEAKELLAARRPDVSDTMVRAFSQSTHGWAAGLKLAGVAGMTEQRAGAGPGVEASDIATYFRTEVLDAQPPPVREFLLTTSVVDVLSADLAVHLSRRSEAAVTLRALADASVFVDPVPGTREEYAYHPLVRDLLRARLHQESPVRKRRLHRRAAAWHAAAGRSTEALRQWAEAGDWEDACALLVADAAVGRLLAGGAETGLGAIFTRMPPGVPGGPAALVSAALAVLAGDVTTCDKHLARVEELVSAPGGEAPGLPAAVALVSMAGAAHRQEPQGVLSAVGRAQDLAAGLEPGPDRATTALILFCLGLGRLAAGELTAAQTVLSSVVREADTDETRPLQARALAHLALLLAVQGDLDAAVEAARDAVHATHRSSAVPGLADDRLAAASPVLPTAVDAALAWVCSDRLDLVRARAHLESADAGPERFRDPVAAAVATLVRSRLLRADGDLVAATRILACRRECGSTGVPAWLARRLDAEEAMLLVAQGRPELAEARVRRHATEDSPVCLLAYAWTKLAGGAVAESGRAARQVIKQAGLPPDLLVEAHLLAAASAAAMAHSEVAAVEVEDAVRLASRYGLRRPLEQAPPHLQALVRKHERRELEMAEPRAPERAGHGTGPGPEGVGPDGCPDGARGGGVLIVQPLTDREREVLAYLDALLPTEEIAARMFVSVNTVKTHVRAILRKLAADRRYEAVRRARELGLL